MKVVVTGGAGFIGSHIVDMLVQNGHKVSVIDSLIHGKTEYINPDVKFYKIDIRDEKVLEVFMEEKPDVLIHEAAQISVPNSIEDPSYDASVNIIGTLNLLEACRKTGVGKIVYPASAAIFGEPEYLPIDEKHPLNMMSGYGVTKHTVEHYLGVYNKLYDIKYTVLRYANVYGPRQDSTGEGGVVAIFCERLLEDKQINIFGDGDQTRDFVYVKDVARANLMAVDEGDNNIFNVCTNTALSVNRLLSIMNGIRGTSENAVYAPEREGDIRHSYMTFEKIKSLMGWQPLYTLEKGLQETFKYYKNKSGR